MLRVLVLFALALPGAPPPSESVPVGDETSAITARLRDPELTLDQRESLRASLLELGDAGALALRRHLEERSGRISAQTAKLEKRYLSDVERVARKMVAARLSKDAEAEIEALRKQLAKLRAEPELTKERVHEVGDPALVRLKELLDVALEDLLAASEELAAQRIELTDQLFELEGDFEWWERCNDVLQEKKRSKALANPAPSWPAIEEAEMWICRLATPMSNSDRDAFARNRELALELPEPEETLGVIDLNLLRVRLGLNALVIDVKLCAAARDHSNDMRTLGFFAHESPVEGKKTPWDRAARFGTSASAENIAAGQSTGAGANLAWWYSPGHHKNMLGGHSRIGLGKSEQHWTQMFN